MNIKLKANYIVDDKLIPIMYIDKVQKEYAYLLNYSPYIYLTVRIPLTTATTLPKDVVSLELSVSNKTTIYDAYLVEAGDNLTTAISKNIPLDYLKEDLVEVTYQLVDPTVDKLANSTGAIALTNTTITEVLNELNLDKELILTPPNNTKKLKLVSIPTTHISNMVNYIQDNYGIYNNGAGCWIEDKFHIYPLFNTTGTPTLIKQDKHASLKLISDDIIVHEYKYIDNGDILVDAAGSSISAGYADSMLTRPFKEGYKREDASVTQSLTGKGRVVHSSPTSNTYKLRSQVMYNSMRQIDVTVTNFDLNKLEPCMPITLMLHHNREAVTYRGIVAHATIILQNNGNPLAILKLLLDNRTKAVNSKTRIL